MSLEAITQPFKTLSDSLVISPPINLQLWYVSTVIFLSQHISSLHKQKDRHSNKGIVCLHTSYLNVLCCVT